MELWIGLTVIGAVIHNVRSILQKNLIGRPSVSGATFARFLYGFPLGWLAVWIAAGVLESPLPDTNSVFLAFAAVGRFTQILGDALYIHLIRTGNFTVITNYVKTETVTAALFSFAVLSDTFSILGLAGIVVAFFGVMVLSAGQSKLTLRFLILSHTKREALAGLTVGALYAVAATSYRGAALEVGGNYVIAAFYAFAWVSLLQTLMMGAWLIWKTQMVLRETLRGCVPQLGMCDRHAGVGVLAYCVRASAGGLCVGGRSGRTSRCVFCLAFPFQRTHEIYGNRRDYRCSDWNYDGGRGALAFSFCAPLAYFIAACSISSSLFRNWLVVIQLCSGPTRMARSLVIKPLSTALTHTFSMVSPK